jgi:hypothetical protein
VAVRLALVTAATTTVPIRVAEERTRALSDRRAVLLASVYYLLAALAVTIWLWRDPASRTVAGNPNDADQFAWFFRYDATAIAHLRLPALVTTAMNAPQGVNVMWNTFTLLPGILLAPVTLLFGPQVSLTVLMTVGFAGSATAMFAVLRRWQVGVPGAALGAAVYGFSPALVQSAIGHYDLQFAVFPPLIADAILRLANVSGGAVRGAAVQDAAVRDAAVEGAAVQGAAVGVRAVRGSTVGGPAVRRAAVRGGLWLGLLVSVQLFISEEILFDTVLAVVLLLVVGAASRPRDVMGRLAGLAAGLITAACVAAVIAGYPLWVQFFGPLQQHGSPFTTDFFKNDLSTFVVPSSFMLFHTAGSAAEALKFQGQLPEYLGYLGWPLIVVLTAGAIGFWRRLPVRACAVTCAVLEVFSLGGTLLASGHEHAWIKLPYYWLQNLPVLASALPDRFSILADGAAAGLLAFSVDAAAPALATFAARHGSRLAGRGPSRFAGRGLSRFAGRGLSLFAGRGLSWLASGRRAAAVVMCCAVLAILPIVPRPLPAAAATPLPSGWSAVFAALRLPPSASVLVVPIPMSTFTEPLRWQADTGQPASLVGGYFMGPAKNGRAYTDGAGMSQAAKYLNFLWAEPGTELPASLSSGVPASAHPTSRSYVAVKAVTDNRMIAQIAAWHVTAVVAVASRTSFLAYYLTSLLGPPSAVSGDVMGWHTNHLESVAAAGS